MEIKLPVNKTYVAAISGGVDSMVLLDLLIKNKAKQGWSIIVAHINHGIRLDSSDDKNLVEKAARTNNLIFESTDLKLGSGASEDLARQERYKFLEELANRYCAEAIITAHHQDDLLETAILNIIRGTGRKGLTSLINNEARLRPLIKYSKQDIKDYALRNNIVWREDSTNTDLKYLRNYIRLKILPRFNASTKAQLLDIINSMSAINKEIDTNLTSLIGYQEIPNELNRNWFNCLSYPLTLEVLATWLRSNNLSNFSSQTLERLAVSAKVAKQGQCFPVAKGRFLIIKKTTLSLSPAQNFNF